MTANTPASILLVEDDPGHALLITKNLRRSGLSSGIIVVDNGRKAVDYLFRQGVYAGQEYKTPDLVLLDLNLPLLSGDQVLRIIKNDDRTKQLPVVILTTTDNPHEVAHCYALGCNMYITKPVEYDRFADAIGKLSKFLAIIKMPDGRTAP